MFCDQRGTRRKNGGKGQEKPAEHRTEIFGQDSGGDGDCSAECEAHEVFVPFCFRQGTQVEGNIHLLLPQKKRPGSQRYRQPHEEAADCRRRGIVLFCAA